MRLLYVIDSLDRPGGAEQALAAMTPHLVSAGVALDIAYLTERPGFQEELRAAGATVHAVAGTHRPARVRELSRLVRARRPDLVHTTLFEADLVGRVAAALTRTPAVSSLVNVAYGPHHRNAPGLSAAKVRAAQAADLATCRLVRRFHALTEHVADQMADRLLLRRSRIDVVPRGRSAAALGGRSPARRAVVRSGLGIPDDAPVLVAAARHEHQKGLDVLLRAFPVVRREHPAAQLVIAGREGTTTDLLRSIAEETGTGNAVHLLGARTDVPDLVAASDVFVAPSRWEGLGSAVVEAMGIGTSIVAADVPAIRETVTGGGALLVRPDDPGGLATAALQVLARPHEAAARASLAKARFGERYTIEAVTAAMLDFYDRSV